MNIENNIYTQNLLKWLNQIMTIELFIEITILYFLIIWIFVIFWVVKDSSNRSNSISFQFFSTIIVIFGTPLSILIYLLIRPHKTLFELSMEEVELNLLRLNKIIEKKKAKIKKQEKQLEKLKKQKIQEQKK